MNATAYPLTWAAGWKRCNARTRAKFGKAGSGWRSPEQGGGYQGRQSLTIDQATRRVIDELRRFGIPDWNVIVSTNLVNQTKGAFVKALLILALLIPSSSFAWDCSYWSQSSNPAAECYRPPAVPNTAVSSSQQSQIQNQSQDQAQTANGGAATNAGNNQSTSFYSSMPRTAPAVAEGSIMITGCGVSGNAGGSNVRGSAFLGVGFTTDECYAFILAQAYQAVGQLQAACEVINTTNAVKRAKKRGFAAPDCTPPAPKVIYAPAPDTYTRKQVDDITKKLLSK